MFSRATSYKETKKEKEGQISGYVKKLRQSRIKEDPSRL